MPKNALLKEILFPHDKVRSIQDSMIVDIYNALNNKKNIIVHAPTGIGKTVSALAPALSFALKKGLTVFFLTSRQTQHKIAVDTLKQIKKKHGNDFGVVDLIGKRWMCLQEIDGLQNSDFLEYCKKLREKNECEFYLNTRKKSRSTTVEAEKKLHELRILGPMHVQELVEECKKPKLCPYEMASLMAKDAKVIIADYNYVFNPNIRDSLLARTGKKLEESIIIVDEGHNLPARARELLTAKISSYIMDNAVKEASKFEYFDALVKLKNLKDIFENLGMDLNFNKEEKFVRKHEFIDSVKESIDYDELVSGFALIGDDIRERQKQSYIGSVGKFLDAWQGQDNGFARILTKTPNGNLILNYKCLDPSLMTRDAIERSYATIIMSGTLIPTAMYADILGFPKDSVEKVYDNPFPKNNRLCLIIPETTTKFTRRNDEEYKNIANVCNKIVGKINGNSILFFPSYELRDKVYGHFYSICNKKKIIEKQNLSKEEKESILEEFKENRKEGCVLLAVSTGSFGEGIDLPGDFLKGVVIVGLPLEKPDLETKELIDYYQEKYGKGMEYGYIFPAITKCLQNAGRCIRSETDKGVIVFLDERFAWENYHKCLPLDMGFKISKNYEERIERFFGS
ncbi:ATP-dependent DNA helicase [Candidatus Woesearchaeota archaeon]|nr:ATP-dependent DNA helicase [Candidatus Woesearchaeota archaeon]